MAVRDMDDEEMREGEITLLTMKKFNAFCAAIVTGAVSASGLSNLVLDKLAEPGEIESLARTALSRDVSEVGQLLRKLVTDVLHGEAESDAVKAVDGRLRK